MPGIILDRFRILVFWLQKNGYYLQLLKNANNYQELGRFTRPVTVCRFYLQGLDDHVVGFLLLRDAAVNASFRLMLRLLCIPAAYSMQSPRQK